MSLEVRLKRICNNKSYIWIALSSVSSMRSSFSGNNEIFTTRDQGANNETKSQPQILQVTSGIHYMCLVPCCSFPTGCYNGGRVPRRDRAVPVPAARQGLRRLQGHPHPGAGRLRSR